MLIVFAIEKAQPRDKPYKLSDGSGLHLLVGLADSWWGWRMVSAALPPIRPFFFLEC
jgi:hypothetical protein